MSVLKEENPVNYAKNLDLNELDQEIMDLENRLYMITDLNEYREVLFMLEVLFIVWHERNFKAHKNFENIIDYYHRLWEIQL